MSICMDHIHGAGAYTIHQYHTHVLNDRNLYEKITKIHEKTNTSRWQATNEQILSIFYSIFCLLFFFKQIFFRKEYKDRDEQSKCWRMYIWRKTKNWRKQCDMVVVCMSSCRYMSITWVSDVGICSMGKNASGSGCAERSYQRERLPLQDNRFSLHSRWPMCYSVNF